MPTPARALTVPTIVLALALPLVACTPGVPEGSSGGGGGAGGGGGGGDVEPPDDSCGDGVVDPGEACDDGDDDETDTCTSACALTDPPDGAPIVAEEGVWTYVPIDGSICRDGSATGIMVNPSSASKNVVIFLEGGGACFNWASCVAGNPDSFDPDGFEYDAGIFDRAAEDNPVRDFSFVYLPYCTGDVHIGDNAAEVPGLSGVQEFRGYDNVWRALERVVPTFPDAELVLLSGVSGGGFGAAGNLDQVKRAFGEVPVVLLDDSGPPMSSERIVPCLQDEWRVMWGFDATVLAECGDACPDGDDYVLDLTGHMLARYPDSVGALVSNTEDGVIRTFYGFGNSDCDAWVGSLPADDFRAGLEELRDFVDDRSPTFGSYSIEGNGHTCIGSDCFYETVVDGVPLTDFVRDLLDGITSHVGPEI